MMGEEEKRYDKEKEEEEGGRGKTEHELNK